MQHRLGATLLIETSDSSPVSIFVCRVTSDAHVPHRRLPPCPKLTGIPSTPRSRQFSAPPRHAHLRAWSAYPNFPAHNILTEICLFTISILWLGMFSVEAFWWRDRVSTRTPGGCSEELETLDDIRANNTNVLIAYYVTWRNMCRQIRKPDF